MPDFSYTPAQIAQVSTLLSSERLAPYLLDSQGAPYAALKLYERNTQLSESLYGLLQGVELALRNSMHNILSQGLQTPEWYYNNRLLAPETIKVQDARAKLLDAGKKTEPGQMLAAFSFGFWVALVSKKYARSLWVPHLHKAFPCKRLSHTDVHARLKGLRDLRNRVAHHEPIYRRNLQSDLGAALETVGWICPVTADWIRSTSSLPGLLQKWP